MTKEDRETILKTLYLMVDGFADQSMDKIIKLCLPVIAIALVECTQTNIVKINQDKVRESVRKALSDVLKENSLTFKRIDQDMPLREI